jgi:polyhydroxybutyrate depolymerase
VRQHTQNLRLPTGWPVAAALLFFSACAGSEGKPSSSSGGSSGSAAGATGASGTAGTISASAGTGGDSGGSAGVTGSAGSSGGSGGAIPDVGAAGSSDAAISEVGDSASGPGDAAVPSLGCGKSPTQALATYVRHTVTGSTRVYDLWVPTGYDPTRAYRTVFLAHGCDGSIPYPMQDATKGDAILVALRSKDSQNSGSLYGGGCFDTMNLSSPEVPYFDGVLKDVSAALCVDKARVFITGHSSGAWLSYLLGCARAGVIRAQGNTAGGLPPGIPTCTGPIAEMGMHDTTDTLNDYAGGVKARDRIIAINKCSQDTKPYDWDGDPKTPSPCVEYQGCLPGYPVVWCQTTGLGHSTQVPMSTVGLFRFWSQF